MNQGWWIPAAIAALSLLSGCRNSNTQVIDASSGAPREVAPTQDLVGMARPPIPDLPIPIGFSLDEGRSRNYTIGSGRIVDHVYRGKGDKLAVKQFYERQMVIQRWALVSAMFVTGDIALDFEKENERCHIVIKDVGTWSSRVEVVVTITTSARLPAPAVRKPN